MAYSGYLQERVYFQCVSSNNHSTYDAHQWMMLPLASPVFAGSRKQDYFPPLVPLVAEGPIVSLRKFI